MIDRAGVDHGRYARLLDDCLMLTSWQHGDADIAAMPKHSAGLGSKSVVMTIFLSDEVCFVTGPDEDASRLTIKGVMPDIVRTRLIGRHATELVSHPILEVPGLMIADIQDSADSASDEVSSYVSLKRVEWPRFDTGKETCGIIEGVRRRFGL